MLSDISVNLLSDLIFAVLLALFAWLLLVVSRRNPLLKFFGVYNSRRLLVYQSNLMIRRGGAIGMDSVPRSYSGTAVPFGETLAASRFLHLFNYPFPSFSDKPGLLSKLWVSDVRVSVLPSPQNVEQVDKSVSVITLGSPAYNMVSKCVEKDMHSEVRFDLDFGQIRVGSLPEAITDTQIGFVERIMDSSRDRCIFYAAGLSELGTAGATHFLATEWKRLHQKYGYNKPFVILLRFADSSDFRRWEIVSEL